MTTSLRMAVSFVALAAAAGCARSRSVPARDDPPPTLQLSDAVRPVHYALDLSLDPAARAFEGRARIDVELRSARRTVWLHGRGLRVTEAVVDAGAERIPASYAQVDELGLARLDLARVAGPGRVTLDLRWEADWAQPWDGVYRTTGPDGDFVATQFEAVQARRAFPGFDDPQFKTPFDVTLTVPAAATAIANTAPVEFQPVDGDHRRIRFATTAPLPTYLLFWAVGPYDVASERMVPANDVRRTPLTVRTVVPRGRGPSAKFVAQAGTELTAVLERWFGIAFPYAKLDHVVVADPSGSAMENAGAIAYGTYVLEPPGGYPVAERIGTTATIAHELAHQWFGDLVTPRWWTDVWLNESFASFMEAVAVSAWRPEWRVDLRPIEIAQGAMELEGLSSARAIRQPLESIADVESQFDATTYRKGARVLGMVERYIGAEAFRSGIHDYLVAHAHGTGSTPDLVDALSRASGKDLGPVFASFLDKPGMPLVHVNVECEGGAARAGLTQSRWLPRGSSADRSATWAVPVCLRYSAGGATHERCTLLDGASASIAIPEGCPAWTMPDAGGAGWYYWSLSPTDLAALRAAIDQLTPAERLSFAHSVWGAQRAGALPYEDAMRSLLALASDPDPAVAAAPIPALKHARDQLAAPDARPAVEAAIRRTYRPVLARVGWEPRPGETPELARLRVETVALLVHFGRDADVRREAARRGVALAALGKPALDHRAVAPDLADIALEAAVAENGVEFWNGLHARVPRLTDSHDRRRVLRALALAQDPGIADRAAQLWREAGLDPSERTAVVAVETLHAETRDRALQTLYRDGDTFLGMIPEFFRSFAPDVAITACDAAEADRVEAWFGERMARWPTMRRSTAQAVETIRLCATERDAERVPLQRFFAASAAPAAARAGDPGGH